MPALYIIGGILLVVVAVLSVPVDISFDVTNLAGGTSRLRVGWLFGLVGRNLLPRAPAPPGKTGRRKRSAGRGRSWAKGVRSALSMARTDGLVPAGIRLMRRTISSIHVRRLDAWLRIGLDDAADTGMLYAVIWPTMLPWASSRRLRLDVYPDFSGPVFEADLRGDVRLFPVVMVAGGLLFAFSPAGLRTAGIVVNRWIRNR